VPAGGAREGFSSPAFAFSAFEELDFNLVDEIAETVRRMVHHLPKSLIEYLGRFPFFNSLKAALQKGHSNPSLAPPAGTKKEKARRPFLPIDWLV
jgi:hypothetical protein